MMNKRGSILVVTLGFMVVFTLLGMGSIYFSTLQNEDAEKRVASTRAFWLAEAGVQKALYEYMNKNCTGLYKKGTTTFCADCATCGSKTFKESLNTPGDYEVEMDSANTSVLSIGTIPMAGSLIQRKIRLDSGSKFKYAAFADYRLDIANLSTVDSYDSEVGKYNPSQRGSNGDIGTNGSHIETINLGQIIEIYGDVSTGPGGTIGKPKNPIKFLISGSETHENDEKFEPVSLPKGFVKQAPINGSATIPSGDYEYSSIKVGNQETLTFDGKIRISLTSGDPNKPAILEAKNLSKIIITPGSTVTIFTDGIIVFKNINAINDQGLPKDFIIFSKYEGIDSDKPGIEIKNNGEFFGAVYAPKTNIDVANLSGIYGSLIGKIIDLKNNTKLHYDESLGRINPGAKRIWKEIP